MKNVSIAAGNHSDNRLHHCRILGPAKRTPGRNPGPSPDGKDRRDRREPEPPRLHSPEPTPLRASAVTTGDGSCTPTTTIHPWYNRIMATNLMCRACSGGRHTLTEVKPDLADTYTVSDDDTIVHHHPKDGLWSRRRPLTVDDMQWSVRPASSRHHQLHLYRGLQERPVPSRPRTLSSP